LTAKPPSGTEPPQSWPSTTPQLAGPLGGLTPHVPRVAPTAIVHVPVQQSEAPAQASPACPQNDEAWHVPFEQSDEQQSLPAAQALPRVLHVALRDAHAPVTQLWLQHSPFAVHAVWSEPHAGYRHTFPAQSPLQQSPAVVHPAPSPRQLPLPPPVPPKTPGVSDASGPAPTPPSPEPDASSFPDGPVSDAAVASGP
jgi:hypothetical protein